MKDSIKDYYVDVLDMGNTNKGLNINLIYQKVFLALILLV